MTWGFVAVAGATLVNGYLGSKSAKDAARRQAGSSRGAIGEQREAREAFEQRIQPFTQVGLSAADPLMNLLGIGPYTQGLQQSQAFGPPAQQPFVSEALPATPEILDLERRLSEIDAKIEAGPQPVGVSESAIARARTAAMTGESSPVPIVSYDQSFDEDALNKQREEIRSRLGTLRAQNRTQDPGTPVPQVQPQSTEGVETPSQPSLTSGQNQLLQDINPLVSFLRQEGFEDIQESAAAKGRLRSGGTLQDLTRFNTQLTSTIVPQLQEQRFNQLFNVLGLGQSSAVGQGQAALQTAGNISNLQQSIGAAQAQGALNQGQAMQNTVSGLAGVYGAYRSGLFDNTPPPPADPFSNTYNTGTVFDPSTGAVGSAVQQPSQMFGGL